MTTKTDVTENNTTYGPLALEQHTVAVEAERVAAEQHIASLRLLAVDIPRFRWNREYQEQAENGQIVQHFPECVLPCLLVEKEWILEGGHVSPSQ